MSVIIRNNYGAIAVNNGVIEKMIVEDMLGMSDALILCNKKGKLIKDKPTPLIDPDYYDAVEVSGKREHVNVKIYIVVRLGNNISALADRIFKMIEGDFDLLRLNRPDTITIKVRGIMSDDIIKRNIDVVRNNA
jgi:uncharacterized alkaline shock family protein YloU